MPYFVSFQAAVILNPYCIAFHAVAVFGLFSDPLFKSAHIIL